jgi:hypothetical protein
MTGTAFEEASPQRNRDRDRCHKGSGAGTMRICFECGGAVQVARELVSCLLVERDATSTSTYVESPASFLFPSFTRASFSRNLQAIKMIGLFPLLAFLPFIAATPFPRAAADTKVELHWNGTCLDLITPSTNDGQIVRMYVPSPSAFPSFIPVLTPLSLRNPCSPSYDRYKNLQLWDVPAPNTAGPIKLSGTNMCLDAGDPPLVNGRVMKIWTW